MKSFKMIRGGQSTTIVELSLTDMLKLLLGREVEGGLQLLIRQRQAYEMFNLAAPKVVKCE